jgi:hypothetical protein
MTPTRKQAHAERMLAHLEKQEAGMNEAKAYRAIRAQLAADELNIIADCVAELSKLMDKFHESHGSGLGDRLDAAFPAAPDICAPVVNRIRALAQSITPPDRE